MINLLPIQERQKIYQKKKERLVIVLFVIAIVSLLSFALVLLSIKFYILADADYEKNILEQTRKNIQTEEFVKLNNTVKEYNKIFLRLDNFYKTELYASGAIEAILNIPKSGDVRFTNFLINRDEMGNIQAGVSGVSATRDGLLDFRKNIEGVPAIKGVAFSPESWISPKDVKFSLTFQIVKNEN
jgi:hypothetical protein